LIFRALPAVLNAHVISCGRFEAKHRGIKLEMLQMKNTISTGAAEHHALQHEVKQASLKHLFSGGRWGSSLQYKAGKDLLKINDYRAKHIHKLHPVIAPFANEKVTF